MRALHLFAGAGGSVIACRMLGFESAGCVEINMYCRVVLRARGEHVIGRDIRVFDATGLAGSVDVVVGGSPCQDLSVAGRREGFKGERSGLWFQQLRVAVECKAPLIWWENVAGALSSNGGRDFLAVLNSLAKAGYDARWIVNRASDVGAPHRRERVWLLAHSRRAGDERRRGSGDIRSAMESIEGQASQREWRGDSAGHVGEVVADSENHGWDERRPWTSERAWSSGQPAGVGIDVGNTVGTRLQERDGRGEQPRRPHATVEQPSAGHAEPGLGGATDGMAFGLDFPAARGLWPVGRGAPQESWEAPRTCGRGQPGRISRLKALGNGWMPHQAVAAWYQLTEPIQ